MPEIGEAVPYGRGGLVMGIHEDGRLDIVYAVKAIDDSGEKVITQVARGVDLESDNIPRELPVIDRRPPAPVEEEEDEEIFGIPENVDEAKILATGGGVETEEGPAYALTDLDDEGPSYALTDESIEEDGVDAPNEPPVATRPTVVEEEEAEADAPADEGETAQMTFSTEMNAADARAKIAELADPTTLQIFVQDETRATVLKAAEKRIEELSA